ncbi:hypothetical protein NP493_31g00002 [Ridgeia piscesae]|uniref:Uncharacterized protein n=1 Tax=Ridgeia piscesae TaxID=27915 RepID=A0AAD9PCX7_RIDPI|nr:hypothetical protein NP493_31g00002 [Ridgeia piscesae]
MISAAAQLLSVQMGLTVGVIKQVPNQPIVFKNDPTKKRRTEDSIIAHTWNTFVKDENASPEMLLRYPMTKAVVRAMDTIQEVTRKVAAHTNITKFIIAGASKRGWTTWTTTSLDKRVVGQMPMVMSLLRFFKNMQKHQSSLGGWTFAFQAYYYENITRYMGHPRMKEIVSLVDPYDFIDKYTIPTMMVDGTSDQFFLPDDSHLFFSQIPGPKYMLMLPNRDHSLIPFLDALAAMKAFAVGVATGFKFPRVSWQLIETPTGGKIVFNSSDVKPTHISSYAAVTATADRRDFRANYGVKARPSYVFWYQYNVVDEGNGIYVAEFDKPDKGWLGFLVEAVYKGPFGHPLTLTSEVNIIPNTFPYPPCHGEGCYETLV